MSTAAVRQMAETAVQTWQKGRVVRAGATAEPHAAGTIATGLVGFVKAMNPD